MGSLSAPFKAFMDATSHLQYAEKRWEGQNRRGLHNGASRGGGKQNSLVQLMTFAAQHQMRWVNLGMNYGNNRSYTNEETDRRPKIGRRRANVERDSVSAGRPSSCRGQDSSLV